MRRQPTTRITLEDVMIHNVLIGYLETEIAYDCQYHEAQIEMGQVFSPAHLETEHLEEGSYVDTKIYLVDKDGDIELCPQADKALFNLAEPIIIEWIIENMTAEIDESITQDASDAAERAVEMRIECRYDRRWYE